MNLEYYDNESTQELTIDLVSVITFSSKDYESVLAVMPRFDKNKAKYIAEKKLISSRDGIIVKNGDWRQTYASKPTRNVTHAWRSVSLPMPGPSLRCSMVTQLPFRT